jgi:hypothetical protein
VRVGSTASGVVKKLPVRVAVPRRAVRREQGRPFVLVAQGDRVERRADALTEKSSRTQCSAASTTTTVGPRGDPRTEMEASTGEAQRGRHTDAPALAARERHTR